MRVRVLERGAHLAEHVANAADGERALLAHDRAQLDALAVFHDEVELPVFGLAEVDDLDDVRVAQVRREARLELEAADGGDVGDEVAGKELDGEGAAERHVLGEADGAHPAFADALEDPVAAREHLAALEIGDEREAVAGTEARVLGVSLPATRARRHGEGL